MEKEFGLGLFSKKYWLAYFFIAIIVVALIVSSRIVYHYYAEGTVPDRGELLAFDQYDQLPLEAPFYPTLESIWRIKTFEDKLKYLYSIDPTAYVLPEQLDIHGFLRKDLTSDLRGGEPKILIFHTHSRETFIDSRKGEEEDTIIGVGNLLADILNSVYNIPVIHDTSRYDVVNGRERRDGSYERMALGVSEILRKHPSIEITIDLHRDGVPEHVHLVQDINGVPTARMMLFNGITCLNVNDRPKPMPDLPNPHLYENLALSLQLQLAANELFPGLMRRIYIKPYRYSLHLKPKSILVEVGANTNTVAEAKSAMWPLAEILVSVLDGNE